MVSVISERLYKPAGHDGRGGGRGEIWFKAHVFQPNNYCSHVSGFRGQPVRPISSISDFEERRFEDGFPLKKHGDANQLHLQGFIYDLMTL